MSDYSSYLFAIPSFAEGIGSLIDFGDTLTNYNSMPSPEIADAVALRSDWAAVGDDLASVISQAQEGRLPV